MGTVTLRIEGTESILPRLALTVERLLAEARAVGLTEFAVTRNGVEVENPDDLVVRDGDLFVILPAGYEDMDFTVDGANDP